MRLASGLILLMGGCSSAGGGPASPPDAGRAPDGASEAGTTAACPAAQPKDGDACGPPGLACEWGAAPAPTCDTLATCTGGRWQVVAAAAGSPVCQSSPAASCAASLATVPVGQHCAPLGALCDYPEGRCACGVRTGAPVTDASADATWICPSPDPACPLPRPRLGAPCATPGLACDYGTCAIPGAVAERCTGGVWVQAATSC